MNERDVFIEALQKESRAQRQEYLNEACGVDEALRQHVESLLEAHDRAGNFLQEPVFGHVETAIKMRDHPAVAQFVADTYQERDTPQPDETSSGARSVQEKLTETQAEAACPEAPSLEFLIPPRQMGELGQLGCYRVLRLIGQGGMGMVFLADDTRLRRQVALKVMRPELAANPASRQRFLRQGRAAAQIHNDHVIDIYQVDQEGDLPFLVMEVLRGRSLADALEQDHRLPLRECMRIAREMAEGLTAVHAAGLIHRDVKPGNVWLEEPNGRVKLLDFGMARARGSPLITQRHIILGTPAYMSPEQATGQPLDDRCDLFSLALLYHILTGQRPFPGDDLISILANLANGAPPPAAGLVPGLPAGVINLLDRLLARDPAGRPASAAEVANSLRVLESGDMVTGRNGDKKKPQRRRRLALIGVLVLACLALGLLVAVQAGAFKGVADDGQTSVPTPSAPSSGAVVVTLPEPPPVLREFPLIGHTTQVQAVAFTADSKTLVSAEYGGQVIYWDMNRREKTFQMAATPWGQLQSLAIDAQKRWLVIGQMNPDIRLFRFGESLAVGSLKGHTDRVVQLAFLKDGRTLLSTGYDGSIRSWDVEKQKEGKPLRAPGRRLDCLAVSEDRLGGLRLALAGPNFVEVDDVQLERLSYQPLGVALSPDGSQLACPAREHGVAMWSLPGKTRLGLLSDSEDLHPIGLAFTPDGKHIIVAGVGQVRIYEADGGKPVARVDHPEKAVSLVISPDGRWLAIGTLKGAIRVWHLPSLLARPS